jgi:hypothetical protein
MVNLYVILGYPLITPIPDRQAFLDLVAEGGA